MKCVGIIIGPLYYSFQTTGEIERHREKMPLKRITNFPLFSETIQYYLSQLIENQYSADLASE